MENYPTQTGNSENEEVLSQDQLGPEEMGATELDSNLGHEEAGEGAHVDVAAEHEQDKERKSRIRLKLGSLAVKLMTNQTFATMMVTAGSMAALNAHDPTWWKTGLGIAAAGMAGIEAVNTAREHFDGLDDEEAPQEQVADVPPPPPPPHSA